MRSSDRGTDGGRKQLPGSAVPVSPAARAVMALAGVAALVAGCGERSQTEQRVAAYEEAMADLANGLVEPTADAVFTKVETLLSSVPADGPAGARAALHVAKADAMRGLAAVRFAGLTEAEAAFIAQRSDVLAGVASLRRSLARLEAGQLADPAAVIDQIAERAVAIRAQAAEVAAAIEEQTRVAGELQAMATQGASDAEALRQRAAELELQAATLRATQALPLYEQVQQLRGEAGQLDGAVGSLQTRIDQIARDVERLGAIAEGLAAQLAQGAAATERVRAAEAARVDAVEAQRAASQREAAALREAGGAMVKVLEETLRPAYERVMETAGGAVESAQRGNSDAKAVAGLSKGPAGQLLADARAAWAVRLMDAAGVLDEVAAVAGSKELADRAAALRRQAEEALGGASEALEAAAEALAGVRVTGPASETRDAAVERTRARAAAWREAAGLPPIDAPVEDGAFDDGSGAGSFEDAGDQPIDSGDDAGSTGDEAMPEDGGPA